MAASKEERPTGPLNVDPALDGEPSDDIVDGSSEEYVDGFSWRVVLGALFVGFIMMPGAIYLSLVAGQGLGPAAEWVTIILFMEVARRSYQTLRKQEIYLLYYMGATLTSTVGALALTGGAFAPLIMQAYVVNSPVATGLGINKNLPHWVSPPPDSPALIERTFMHPHWRDAILLLMFVQLFSRMMQWGIGYVVFRVTSDVEKLPFPLAPIAAAGATALAESSAQKEGWRWRVFSIGAMIGVGWGCLYILLPVVTGLIFAQPIVIVTNPFIDLTPNTQKILPAALSGIGTDLGTVLIGFVLPIPVVIGTFVSTMACHIVANPFLHKYHILKQWTPGIDMTNTQVANYFDYWLSFGIGVSAVVAILGVGSVIRALWKNYQATKRGQASSLTPPPGRGDIPMGYALGAWFIGTVAFTLLCHHLVPKFPVGILIFFGFVWTPIISYINARMAGMAGSAVSIPYMREASIMQAGYTGYDVWFAPIPLNDYGGMAQHFRVVELTKTKFISIVKVELLVLPIMLLCSFLYWSFIWKLAPIPSSVYPYASKFWPVHAQTSALWMTANQEGSQNILLQSINTNYIAVGGALTAISYAITIVAGLPILFFYGLANGVSAQPFQVMPMMIGALLGRYYFGRRYGRENWAAYAPVLVAGYYCGMGLIGMGAVSLALLSKSVSRLPF